jgi:signal transduction histidine kinase
MPTRALARHRRALTVFIVGLLMFLVVFDGFIIQQQRQVTLAEIEAHTQQEFLLLGELTSAALTQGNYAVIEQALADWGSINDNILQARLVAENGFVIAEYEADYRPTRTEHYSGMINYGIGRQVRIEVLKDMAPADAMIMRLATWLFGFSALVITLLGVFLHRFAIIPLQREIEQHLQTEQQLREHSRELQALNEELTSFNYSLSHDLRTPLRAITSYSQIIQQEDAARLSDESKRFFSRIVDAGKHMALLIDDMLRLAQVTRTELSPVPVDLSALAAHILKARCKPDTHCDIQPGLVALGNRHLLGQLLENLFGNAIKYTSRQINAEIRFGARDINGEQVFFVSDNGVGFDMRFVDKVFEPFQRLHDPDEYPGTGIGMATAKRIVNRHDGRIWVESESDVGTTFYFTLGLGQPVPETGS